LAGTVRNWMANTPSRLVVMRKIGGLVMILLGVFTLLAVV
ncbi:MAG: hypothetical protein RL464_983, partial [Actinomycetota bacterium]